MSEDIKAGINEILGDVDQLLTEEYVEGVTLWDLVLESFYEVVTARILYGNDAVSDQIEFGKKYVAGDISSIVSAMGHFGKSGKSIDDTPGEFIMTSRGGGKQSRINEHNFEDQMNNLSKAFELGESAYSIWPISLDSLTDTTKESKRPRKRGERCDTCSNMKKKELKKYDSCPSCGRSLFALKGRGW